MTSTELVTLKKVLSLEKSKGYKNTAVVGGLDRFLARWVEGRAADSLIEPLPEEYASLKAAQRRKWIDNALTALETGVSPPKKKASSPRARSSPKQEPSPEHSLASPVSALPRVTPTVEGKLKRLGVHTIRDLLYLFPRRHNDFGQLLKVSELEIDAEQTVMVNVWEARETLLGRADQGYGGSGRGRDREPEGGVVQPAIPGEALQAGDQAAHQRQGERVYGIKGYGVPGVRDPTGG